MRMDRGSTAIELQDITRALDYGRVHYGGQTTLELAASQSITGHALLRASGMYRCGRLSHRVFYVDTERELAEQGLFDLLTALHTLVYEHFEALEGACPECVVEAWNLKARGIDRT